MASSTKPAPKGGASTSVQTSRTHDYLYDPNYIVSGARDHYRTMYRANTGNDRMITVPNYNSMFSELRHHPPASVHIIGSDPVPSTVNRSYRGPIDGSSQTVPQFRTTVHATAGARGDVGGTHRFMYFRRPIVPYMTALPPEVLLQATEAVDPLAPPQQRPPTPPTRTVGVQTMYRESEAQTDPYTPEYTVRPGAQPELLTLATLSYGRGLPATLAEVEMIERARAKRAWEATLPGLSEPGGFELRRKMMEEMELQEWKEREAEIQRIQEARLEVLKQVLAKRNAEMDEAQESRLNTMWHRRERENDHKNERLRSEAAKTIRKLMKARANPEGAVERRDVVREYADPSSGVYAPLTREGVFPDRTGHQFVVRSVHLDTYEGLCALERSLPASVFEPVIKVPFRTRKPRGPAERREAHVQNKLREMEETIRERKEEKTRAPKPLKFCTRIEKPAPRPPTPTVEVASKADDAMDRAVIFLQQLLRGRAMQNRMFDGKERRLELIRELRSTHAIESACEGDVDAQRQTTVQRQQERAERRHAEAIARSALEAGQGAAVADTLDFLSKELVRLQEERRIAAMVRLAERERRMREAEESGRRAMEEERRAREDEVFRTIVNVHKDTVDTYLEDVVGNAVEGTAERQAREFVRERARQLNDIVDEMEKRKNYAPESVVANLVSSFLLPEVERQTLREKLRDDQLRFMLAARRTIDESMGPIERQLAESSAEPAEKASTDVAEGHVAENGASADAEGGSHTGAAAPAPSAPTSVARARANRNKSHDAGSGGGGILETEED
eukprot:Opistho-2@61878